MTLIGVAYNSWFFWDGRKDSLWAQALGPIESPVEHGFTRTMCALVISEHYRREYEEVFGPIPDIAAKMLPGIARPADDDPGALKAWVVMSPNERRVVNEIYVNMGKAIGAYVRTIIPGPSPFDVYVEALMKEDREAMEKALKPDEERGLRLFIGKAGCTNCHNGPMLTNGDFHNIGVPGRMNLAGDRGRAEGITKVLSDEFNCLSEHSDADAGECRALRFIDTAADRYFSAFKTPTLRNVAGRGPYMNAGQFATLGEVLEFYRTAKTPEVMHGELTDVELKQLEAFLLTLSGPVRSL
jgi:cytochrome c peroxidase